MKVLLLALPAPPQSAKDVILFADSRTSSKSQAEYRNEIFYPPYWYDFDNKPIITAINSNSNFAPGNVLQVGYGEELLISYASLTGKKTPKVTDISIVAPSSTTHSFNFNQRVVFLPVVRVDPVARTIRVQTPPNPNVAMPQMYMIFPLNGKTYGPARWIQLVDKKCQACSE